MGDAIRLYTESADVVANNDFFSFLEACSHNETGLQLMTDLYITVKKDDATILLKWFIQKGFNVSLADCKRMIENKNLFPTFKNNVKYEGY